MRGNLLALCGLAASIQTFLGRSDEAVKFRSDKAVKFRVRGFTYDSSSKCGVEPAIVIRSYVGVELSITSFQSGYT